MKSKAFYITKLPRRHSRGIIIKINVSRITESVNAKVGREYSESSGPTSLFKQVTMELLPNIAIKYKESDN